MSESAARKLRMTALALTLVTITNPLWMPNHQEYRQVGLVISAMAVTVAAILMMVAFVADRKRSIKR